MSIRAIETGVRQRKPATLGETAATDARYMEWAGTRYCVRTIAWSDERRQAEYQQLRAKVFVDQLAWDLPIEPDGREADRYDIGGGQNISVHGVYGLDAAEDEHLLGGVRIFTLRDWDDSMVTHEFLDGGMLPKPVVRDLCARVQATDVIELTRLCTLLRQPAHRAHAEFDMAVVRDLVYAAITDVVERTGRRQALAVVSSLFYRVMRQSHFVVESLYDHQLASRSGYSLVLIAVPESIRAIRAVGEHDRADRMVAFCEDPRWFDMVADE